jgi:GNAT superfamily N-acetyltransferase
MILREAGVSDVSTIWEILQQAIEQRRQEGSEQWQNGYPNETTVQDDIKKGYAYVLDDNGTIIAYAAIIFDAEPTYNDIKGQWLTNGNYAAVHRVATANAVKGKGIATRLIKMIEAVSRGRNVYSVKLDTNFDNVPMLRILDKSGYTYCGEIFFNGAPRRAYEKILQYSNE